MPTADEPCLGQTPVRMISSSEFAAAFDLLGVVDPVRRGELRGAVMIEAGRYLRRTEPELLLLRAREDAPHGMALPPPGGVRHLLERCALWFTPHRDHCVLLRRPRHERV
jgi:hypothetical protein